MHEPIDLLINLSVCFVAALGLGLVTQRLGLSPILGYILAGVALGPQTPGFVADQEAAAQFAEIGVVLLMFGVGLHFHLKDLLQVRRIAVPGAIFQIGIAMALAMTVGAAFDRPPAVGLIYGLALSVASTVVLIRVLMDNNALHSPAGHIAVGWLIVEDVFTVLALVVLPAVAGMLGGDGAAAGDQAPLLTFALALARVAGLVALVLVVGGKVVPWLLGLVVRSRSRELFTLAILAIALAVATGSAVVFGVSLALGAFLAGVVVGQSEVSHQAAADALPMRDAFAVLFFVSVGMLFDPAVFAERPGFLLSMFLIVMVGKPVAALIIVWFFGYSIRTALTVAVGLAQIGEFSFILGRLATGLGLLPPQGQSLLVTCACLSIAINPLAFGSLGSWERWLRSRERLWAWLSRRSEARRRELGGGVELTPLPDERRAIVVGHGPVGRQTSRILESFGMRVVVVDLNIDTIRALGGLRRLAVYGDAARPDILAAAGIAQAQYVLVTTPDAATNAAVVETARRLNPKATIIARARYLRDQAWLQKLGAVRVACEERELTMGLVSLLLEDVGADEDRVREELNQLRASL